MRFQSELFLQLRLQPHHHHHSPPFYSKERPARLCNRITRSYQPPPSLNKCSALPAYCCAGLWQTRSVRQQRLSKCPRPRSQSVPRRHSVLTPQAGDDTPRNSVPVRHRWHLWYIYGELWSGLLALPGEDAAKTDEPFKWGGRVPEPRRSVWTCSLPLVCYPPYGFPNQCRLRWCRASSRERDGEGGRGRQRELALKEHFRSVSLPALFLLHAPPESGGREMTTRQSVVGGKKKQFKSLKIHCDWVYLLQIQVEADFLQYIEWIAY